MSLVSEQKYSFVYVYCSTECTTIIVQHIKLTNDDMKRFALEKPFLRTTALGRETVETT